MRLIVRLTLTDPRATFIEKLAHQRWLTCEWLLTLHKRLHTEDSIHNYQKLVVSANSMRCYWHLRKYE